METRAPYALIGLFVLAAIGAVFGFVYWLHNTGGLGERTVYRVRFENTVSGLLTGAAVLFNGIRVGEVTDLQLNRDDPRQVMATIEVVSGTPVRADTQAGLEFQGLTGVPVVSLRGGNATAATPATSKAEPAVLVADPAAGESMTEAARAALRRLDGLLADNSDAVKSVIANLNTFSGALARNSDRVDSILSGLERMTGGGAAKAIPATYDLNAPRSFPPAGKPAKSQLIVLEPTAPITLDSQKIAVQPSAGENPSLESAQWSDNIPKLLQEKIIQSFENSNYLAAVARPMEGLNADYQLLIDIRNFEISAPPAPATATAHVEFAAKIVDAKGRIIGSKTFEAVAPVHEMTALAVTSTLDNAFGKAVTALVVWTASVI